MSDPIIWRGAERLLVVSGAIVFGYLGYKLYVIGLTKGKTELNADSKIIKFAVSGTGPGLLFMSFGALVLIFSLFTGGASQSREDTSKLSDRIDVVEKTIRDDDTVKRIVSELKWVP